MATKDLPVLQRQVKAEATATPEFQSAVQNLAASQNNLSAIGAGVAQSASNAMATQLGYETGKNPIGDLTPPITEFDKNFSESYHSQANATLTLQGEKLLTETQIEMSKPARLTPDLIAKTNAQLQTGLDKIAENAPTAIKGHLKAGFDSSVLNQNKQYETKMISEQREDQKNTLINAMELSTKNALELASNGDVKGARNAVIASQNMAVTLSNNKFVTPEAARIAHESAVQAELDGTYINKAMQAEKEGKLAEFQKNYADNKPANMTNEQWVATGQAFNKQMNFLQGLRQQDENLRSQQMLNQIATNPSSITGTQWKTFADSVSPLQAEQVRFKYIQALKSNNSGTIDADSLIRNFSNPEVWANSTDKNKNAAFNKQVDYSVQNSQNTPTPLSHEQAQVQVAASAGGEIPVFTNDLKNKIHSGNPAYIESASQQIHALKEMGAGQALRGLSKEDNSLYSLYESLRASRDPLTAAREATDIIHNQDPAVQEMNKQKWSNFVSSKASGTPLSDFALSQVKLNKKDFGSVSMAQVYGTEILNVFQGYYTTLNGDQETALKLTKDFVDENFGDTGVNGGRQKTLHPVEMVVGFKNSDGVPYIQKDMIKQINDKLLPIKESYQKKTSNEYWETVPLSDKTHGVFRTTYDPVKIKRHTRVNINGVETEKVDTFDVILHGNNFDNYDVAIMSKSGLRNLFQEAPYLGITTYTPNKDKILANYNKDNHFNESKNYHDISSSKKIDTTLGDKR